jgi:hypothetical protein
MLELVIEKLPFVVSSDRRGVIPYPMVIHNIIW